MPKLQPPKNVREHNAKCCANCGYRSSDDDGEMICLREPDYAPWADFGDDETGIHLVVCDGHKPTNKRTQRES